MGASSFLEFRRAEHFHRSHFQLLYMRMFRIILYAMIATPGPVLACRSRWSLSCRVGPLQARAARFPRCRPSPAPWPALEFEAVGGTFGLWRVQRCAFPFQHLRIRDGRNFPKAYKPFFGVVLTLWRVLGPQLKNHSSSLPPLGIAKTIMPEPGLPTKTPSPTQPLFTSINSLRPSPHPSSAGVER